MALTPVVGRLLADSGSLGMRGRSVLLVLVALLPACAFGDRSIALQYEVERRYAQTGADYKDPVVVLDFDDARPQPIVQHLVCTFLLAMVYPASMRR